VTGFSYSRPVATLIRGIDDQPAERAPCTRTFVTAARISFPERFSESLDRARELLRRPNRDELDRRIQAMIEMHERRQSVRPHIVVREHERYLLVPTSEIHCLEATGNYVQLHCERANHILRSTLSAVEAKLDPVRFLRIHRSWIVNLEQVREAQPWTKGGWILLTRRGLKVPVGQQYHHVLSKILR